MTKIHIGGHRRQPKNDAPGLDVYRTDGGILKEAHTEGDNEGIQNEARMLKIMSGTGFAPEFINEGEGWLLQEDLGDTQPINDGEIFRQNCARLLWTLRWKNVCHADLTGQNIIVSNDKPIAIDFQQSHLYSEPAWPNQRSLCDAYYMWRYVNQAVSKIHSTPDTPRVSRRWASVLGSLTGNRWNHDLVGKKFLDLGCFQGDFCAMAAAEGMNAHGVDQGGFRQGENSIENARQLWGYMSNCTFTEKNIMEWGNFKFDVVIMFSTWPYIVQDFGKHASIDLLGKIIDECEVFFFETQLYGDGPGPNFLLEDSDVANMLGEFGKVQSLITIPVTGRPANRTVWRVEK